MVDAKEKYRELTALSDEIARCGRCGFCQSVCPVYQVSADECGVARGRNMYAKELLSGSLELSRENEAFFSECLLCRACVDVCFSEVKTDEIVLAGRRSLRRLRGISPVHKYIFERFLPDHQKMEQIMRLAATTGRLAPTPLLSVLRMVGALASISRGGQISRDLPKDFLRERLARRKASGGSKRALFFVGCGTNFMFPRVGEATVAILEKLGYDVALADHGCCGLPAFAHGETAAAVGLASDNMRAFSREPDSIIVTDCSSCASFLKDYPKLLSTGGTADRRGHYGAERFASRVRDMTEVLAEEIGDRAHISPSAGSSKQVEEDSKNVGSAPVRVTFHDPCHLSRYQKLSHLPRQVLRSLPGVEFIEMKEADWCCGGAGAFAVEHPQLSLQILERKIQNAASSGANMIATTCPSCLMQLRSGLKKSRPTIRAAHLVEIVHQRLHRP